MHTTQRRRQQGFTLVEAMVALAVTGVLAGLAVPSFRQSIERRHVEGVAAQVETDLQLARSLAVSQGRNMRVEFASGASASCYVIHTGAKGDCSCGADGSVPVCRNGIQPLRQVLVSAAAARVQSNASSIVIESYHGTVTPTATIRVSGQGGASLHEVVNVLGRVRACSPDGSVPGYKRC